MLQKINETKVDIILPNYNSGQFFSETIDSILNQTFKNWQLIIVDDAGHSMLEKGIQVSFTGIMEELDLVMAD